MTRAVLIMLLISLCACTKHYDGTDGYVFKSENLVEELKIKCPKQFGTTCTYGDDFYVLHEYHRQGVRFVGKTIGEMRAEYIDSQKAELLKEKQPKNAMQEIFERVASDAKAQYDIVSRSGSSMDMCVHSGLVAAAFLQAKNEDKYNSWKAIEKMDCMRAGIR